MSGFGTWTNRLGGFIAVWLMATMILGPAIDSFVCKDESEPATASSILAADETVASDDHTTADAGHGAPAMCAHGHCHHGMNLGLVVAMTDVAPTAANVPHDLAPGLAHPSRIPSGLERPPRA